MFSIGFAPRLPVNSKASVNTRIKGTRQIRNIGGFKILLTVLIDSMIFKTLKVSTKIKSIIKMSHMLTITIK